MKAINRIIELIGVSALFLLGVGVTIEHSPNLIISIAIIIALAILSGVLLWISGLHEKRLEDKLYVLEKVRSVSKDTIETLSKGNVHKQNEIRVLELDFANQVKATDLAEDEATHWRRKYDELNALNTLPTQALTSAGIYPFNSDNTDTTEQYICPECGEEMTRESKSMIFCDNPACHRKQWRKDKLQ